MHFIALDVDGVISDSYAGIPEYVKGRFGKSIKIKDINKWNFFEDLYGKEEALKLYRNMWINWKEVPPMEPHAIEYANQLRKFGRAFIVTGRQDFQDISNVVKWLTKSGLFLDGILTVNIETGLSKTTFTPPFDIYIDDSPSTATKIIKETKAFIYLRSQPWNKTLPSFVTESKRFKRIGSLREVLKDLEKKA